MTSAIEGVALPKTWCWAQLRHVTSALRRGTAPEYVDEGPIRAISQAANQANGLDWGKTRFHSFAGNPRSLRGYLEIGDVIVNSTGTGTLGRVGQYSDSVDGRPCIADGHLTIVRSIESKMHPRFSFYYLSSSIFQHYLMSTLVTGATNQIELSADRLGSAPVALPPLEEQRRIASFLDFELCREDSISNAQVKAKSVLAERRLALVQHFVTGGNRIDRQPSGVAWADFLPKNWVETKINFVARMGSGHTPSRSNAEWWTDCTVPWITTGEVSQVRDDRREEILETREMISRVGMANSSARLYPAGTVVLSRTASAGFSAVMGRDMATSQDFATWTCGPRLDPYYLLWCLRAMRSDLLGRLAMGSTHKTIYVPDLQSLRIPLPPIDEQRDIVTRIRASNLEIEKLMDLIDRQQSFLFERRQALITAAVTGKIDPAIGRSVRGT